MAAFFYLRVIVLMYFCQPAEDSPTVAIPNLWTTGVLTACVLITLFLGIAPSLVLDWTSSGAFALQ